MKRHFIQRQNVAKFPFLLMVFERPISVFYLIHFLTPKQSPICVARFEIAFQCIFTLNFFSSSLANANASKSQSFQQIALSFNVDVDELLNSFYKLFPLKVNLFSSNELHIKRTAIIASSRDPRANP